MDVAPYMVLTDDLVEALKAMSEDERLRYLFLEEHPHIAGAWEVDGFDKGFYRYFKDVLNRRRAVTPFSYAKFKERADEHDLIPVFYDDPAAEFALLRQVGEEPDVKLNVSLPGAETINGFLPFQAQGYNLLRSRLLEYGAAKAQWTTGCGKTVLADGLVAAFEQDYNLCLFVVQAGNRINTQRSLKNVVGIDAIVVDGDRDSRQMIYEWAREATWLTPPVLVLNYEKFRDDEEALIELVTGRDVFVIWDEMPTKLSSRSSQLYKAVCRTLYTNHPNLSRDGWRARELRQLMLSATPIENDPEGLFNCVRILWPELFGTVDSFHQEYVASWRQWGRKRTPSTFKNIDLMAAKLALITHQADKEKDPEIKRQFPRVLPDPVLVDLDIKQWEVYELLMKQYKSDLSKDLSADMMSRIGVAQMLLCHPMAVVRSARSREIAEAELQGFGNPKEGSALALRLAQAVGFETLEKLPSAKTERLGMKLEAIRHEGKAVVFTTFNHVLMPSLMEALDEWGLTYVPYTGSMSAKAKQESEDQFREDPDCKVFLATDSASNSLNLEAANLLVNYDFPWKWTTLTQRNNRIHRLTSTFEQVTVSDLIVPGTVEDRRLAIIGRKKAFHDRVYNTDIADQSESLRLTRTDLMFALLGHESGA